MYEVLLERRAQRNLRRLPKEEFKRAIRVIKRLGSDPRRAGCRKIAGSESDWRVRFGDYRVIYEIDDSARVVRIMYIRHRRYAYR